VWPAARPVGIVSEGRREVDQGRDAVDDPDRSEAEGLPTERSRRAPGRRGRSGLYLYNLRAAAPLRERSGAAPGRAGRSGLYLYTSAQAAEQVERWASTGIPRIPDFRFLVGGDRKGG
jgi:hypothetical protein